MIFIKVSNILNSIFVCIVLSFLSTSFTAHALDGAKRLPPIWSDPDYELRAEVELLKSKQSFFIEEWTSVATKQFRLDLIDTTNGRRTTYLAHDESKEKFLYEPFTCSLVENFNDVLPRSLADLFPKQKHQGLLSIGIGALWMYATNHAANYFPPQKERPEVEISPSLLSYGKYQVPASVNESFPYTLNLYFNEDLGSGPNSIVLIRLEERVNGVAEPIMGIKVLELDKLRKTETGDDNLQIFNVPVGFGCPRNIGLDEPVVSQMDKFLSRQTPRILQMNLVARVPVDELDELDRWKSHSVSLRLTSGRLSLGQNLDRDFMILESEDYAPILLVSSTTTEMPNKVQLRRVRRAFDLGQGGLDTWAGPREPAIWYEIDERSGMCIGQGETDIGITGSVQFPLGALFGKRQQPGAGKKSDAANDTTTKQQVSLASSGIYFTTDLMSQLFSKDTLGFQLIKDKTEWQASNKHREIVFEKRVDNFQMRNQEGEVIWSGPISLVRRYAYELTRTYGKPQPLSELSDPDFSSSIYFLSTELDQLVGSINVQLDEARPIYWGALHRELDVGLCFDQMARKNLPASNYVRELDAPLNGASSLRFTVSYPLELDSTAPDPGANGSDDDVDKVAELANSNHSEMDIYEQFLMSVSHVARGRLDLLQVSDIRIDFGPKMLKISGKLLARPSLLGYRRMDEQRFADAKRSQLFTELKPNEESCAESCSHYNCPVFSYCASTSQCDLLLQADTWQLLNPTGYAHDASCTVFRARGSHVASALADSGDSSGTTLEQKGGGSSGAYLSPAAFIFAYRQAIAELSDDDSTQVVAPLTLNLRLSKKSSPITLRPSSVDSVPLDANQEIGEFIDDSATSAIAEAAASAQSALRPEYQLVLEHRHLVAPQKDGAERKRLFPVPEAKPFSYLECDSLCAQLDCNSFSHCRIEQTCQVSQLHESAELREHSADADGCFVAARDYLSKFRATRVRLSAWPPAEFAAAAAKWPAYRVAASRDCATRCMQEQQFKCRSFYYKAPDTERSAANNCYLRKSHMTPSQVALAISTSSASDSPANSSTLCELHTRSYLAEFDKFHGKALPVNEQQQQVSIQGLGAEGCGAECAERTGDCRAFHVCRPPSAVAAAAAGSGSGRPVTGPLCVLQTALDAATGSGSGSGANQRQATLASRLVDDKGCTAFVVAAQSELNRLQVNGSNGRNRELRPLDWDENGQEIGGASYAHHASSSSSRTSWWLKGPALTLLGLVIGYVAAFALGLRR